MLRWLLLSSAVLGCLLPAVEYEAPTAGTEDALTPVGPQECSGEGNCCSGVECATPVPSDVVCSELDGNAATCLDRQVTPAPAPSCSDGLLNQDETDLDCGGPCGRSCARGQQCARDADCAAGLWCSQDARRCTEPSCADGERNGNETQTDCGGGQCPLCAEGAPCRLGSDCASGLCGALGSCVAPACDDGVQNGDEAGVDCGGSCAGCPTGVGCAQAADCQSGVCANAGCAAGLERCCQAPSCSDDVRNGNEAAVDCGNAACGPCAVGSPCTASPQCASQLCQAGVCQAAASCTDGVRNGTETDIDCGGTCPRCADLSACSADTDCINNVCLGAVCISCGDGVMDGTETDIDCGGADPFCRRCLPGERCLLGSDCQSGLCGAASCQ